MSPNAKSVDPHGFDPEIREIEKEVVEFFSTKGSEFTGRHPIISTVMTYFYIRKNLTQHELQILTGYSAGTISKAVRQLIKMNMVTKETIPGTHKHIYKMENLPIISPSYFLRTENVMDKKIAELQEIKKVLDDNTGEMKKFETYQNAYAIVTQLLMLLPTISDFLESIDKEMKKQKQTEHRPKNV
jgi:DNA-binding transcriptional regulator GbsR (MarR family)